MPLLGFKRQFSSFVQDGSKFHTLRAKRKNRPRVGDTCHCFEGLRTKKCRLLRRSPCIRVQDVRIEFVPDGIAYFIRISIDGAELSMREAGEFAWRDGFRTYGVNYDAALSEFAAFWEATHDMGRGDSWEGDLISWNPQVECKKP